jgi:putative inorganic carbon (hco3(-)) transporter
MAILFVTLRNLYRTRHKTPSIANLATAFMLVIISFMTTGIFLHLSYVRYFALMLALASVASIISPQDPPPHREASALVEASSEAPILIPTETGLQGGRA